MRGDRKIVHYKRLSSGDEENIDQPNLPDIPLPIGNSLPVFDLAPTVPASLSQTIPASSNFQFSRPSVKAAKYPSQVIPSGTIHFSFSNPKSPRAETTEGGCVVQSLVTISSQSNMASLSAAVFTKPASWQCESCLVSNSSFSLKCKACGLCKSHIDKGISQSRKNVSSSLSSSSSDQQLTAALFTKPNSWTCEKCMVRNPSNIDTCKACQALRPTCDEKFHALDKMTTRKVVATSASTDIPSSSLESSVLGFNTSHQLTSAVCTKPNTWQCNKCSSSNPSDVTKCTTCQSPKPACTTKSTAATAPLTAAMFTKPNSWKCNMCFISNPPDSMKCKACETSKPGNTTNPASVAAPLTAAMFSKPNSWKCNTCFISNPPDAMKCKACETSKPGNTTNPASVAAPLTAAMFSKPNSWKCNTCFISNPPDAMKCKACETSKPGNTTNPASVAAPLTAEGQCKEVKLPISQPSDVKKQPKLLTQGFKLTGSLVGKSTSTDSSAIGSSSNGFKLSSSLLPSTKGLGAGFDGIPCGNYKISSASSFGEGGFKLVSSSSVSKKCDTSELKGWKLPKEIQESSSQSVSCTAKFGASSQSEITDSRNKETNSGFCIVGTNIPSLPSDRTFRTTTPSVGSELQTSGTLIHPHHDSEKLFTNKPLTIAELAASGQLTVQSAVEEHQETTSKQALDRIEGSKSESKTTDGAISESKQSAGKEIHFLQNVSTSESNAAKQGLEASTIQSESRGKGFQLLVPPVLAKSTDLPTTCSSGSNVHVSESNSGQLGRSPIVTNQSDVFKQQVNQTVNMNSDLFVSSDKTKRTSSGLIGSFNQSRFTLNTDSKSVVAFGNNEMSDFSRTGPFTLSGNIQSKSVGSSTNNQLREVFQSQVQSREESSTNETSQSLQFPTPGSSQQATRQESLQQKPTFNFGVQQQGSQEQQAKSRESFQQKPTFSFGVQQQSSQEQQASSQESLQRPTFNFGVQQQTSRERQANSQESQQKPTFKFGLQREGSQERSLSLFGGVSGSNIQPSGSQQDATFSSKPSFSLQPGADKNQERPIFGTMDLRTASMPSSLQIGQQKQSSMLGQPSALSTTMQPFQFGMNQTQSHPTFRFGSQSGTSLLPASSSSSGLLSNNPFRFPQPGAGGDAPDQAVGMVDVSSGLSDQQQSGGYDFSSSLQSSGSFTFGGDSSVVPTPFANQSASISNMPSRLGGRKTKTAVRRVPKKR